MLFDTIVIGGGIAGLTCSAFLAQSGRSILLLEQSDKLGGCINSFERDGFIFDGGARAIENSGVLFPMLRQLGIEIEWIKNHVSLGLGKDIVRLENVQSLTDYESLLKKHFPENSDDIKNIIQEMKKITNYMNILYGIDNPLFLDFKKDRKYFITDIIPWMFKYLATFKKIETLKEPVKKYLGHFTPNQSLIDIITQHFFRDTPVFFALGYFQLYLSYYYPRGGTKVLPDKLEDYISNQGVQIKINTKITEIWPEKHQISDKNGNRYEYKKLVWAADLKTLYDIINTDTINDFSVRTRILSRKKELSDKTGGDSIFTLYLGVDMDKRYFANISTEHFFFTPFTRGILKSETISLASKEEAVHCLREFFKYNTFEISCPVLRDSRLAPVGKTGLIVSTLFDYSVAKNINDNGWYEEFKNMSENIIINILNDTIYPGIKDKITLRFSSTPLTHFKKHGNLDGAITGWAFTNAEIPAETRLLKIANSVRTPIPDIIQAGQWAYSPSGIPVSIITGKLAADEVLKNK